MKISLNVWDLAADDNRWDELIDTSVPFFLNLNLDIKVEDGRPGSMGYILYLTNIAHIEKHKFASLNHILLLREPFYPTDIVAKIEEFLSGLEADNYDHAIAMLEEVFLSEFKGNFQNSFEKLFMETDETM